MLAWDPEDPVPYVQKLIDKVNEGERLDELELWRLRNFYCLFGQVADLVNETGRRILWHEDVNELPI